MNNNFMRFMSRLLVVSVLCITYPLQPASAGMIGTEAAQLAQQSVDARARVEALLQRADVRAELERLGVDPALAQSRVAALTDQEVNQLAGKLDQLPAGGIDWLGVILVVFVVLVITDFLGLTKIFPWTK